MSAKRAARRRAAKSHGKAHSQELSPEQEAGLSTVALLLAMGATDPATADVGWHGQCALGRRERAVCGYAAGLGKVDTVPVISPALPL